MDKKISELDPTLNLSDQADFPLSQDNGGEPTTFRAKLTQIATKIAEAITFSNLKTGDKQLVSAVNQTISNLADDFNTTAGSTYAKDDCVLYNGVLYQCINNSGTTSGTFIDADWIAIKAVDVGSGGGGGGGAGGHTIVDNAGTSLPQRSKLQFIGAYSEDNSTDDTTEVNVVRSMTKAEFNQLSADEKTGFINITDETSQINATEIPISSSDNTNTKDYIDTRVSGKANKSNVSTESYKTLSSSDMTFDSGLSLHQTNQVYRIGRWCILTISVKINRSVSGNCYITNYIPSDYLPYLKITTAVENGLGDGKVTPIELQTDGKLRIFPTALNTNIYAIGTVIYPLADQS